MQAMTRLYLLAITLVLSAGLDANASGPLEITGLSVGTWTRIDLPAEDVRYVEALSGENVLFWKGSGGVLRRATYTWDGTTMALGAITSPTGLTSGDHPTILNNGGGALEGYFHPGTGPSVTTQNHASSADGGATWTGETAITYPFPTPGVGSDSGTTGGGGIVEVVGDRRIYAQNNFGDIIMYSTSAGSSGPLTSVGAFIDGNTGNFQNQSPSGDAVTLPTGNVLYFYTDGEGSESTLGAVGVLLLDLSGVGFADQEDNFVHVADAGLAAVGMTALDEMTVNNIVFSGSDMTALLILDGNSTANGSAEDIFYAPITISFNQAIEVGEINTSALSENGWFSDDTRADGTGSEAIGTNLISDTLTDDPEATASGSPTHDGDILLQIPFVGPAPGVVPAGTHPHAVHMTIAGTPSGKSQISHRKDDGIGHATGSSFGPGFSAEYSWMGDGTASVTASLKFGIKTSEFGSTGASSRTGENVWDKVLIYEPGNLNGGTSDGAWHTETTTHTSGKWWFFDRTAGASIIGTPMTLFDMSTSGVLVGGGPKTVADVYALITAPGAHITSTQFGIGSGNAGGSIYVNQLVTNFYRAGDTTTFGSLPPPDTVYVDDDYADNSPGDMVNFPDDGGVGPFEVGFDAFATVQEGLDGVGDSTVNVAAGTYNENLTLSSSVTLQGPNVGISPITGTRVAEAIMTGSGPIFLVNADDVTIDGFQFDIVSTTMVINVGVGLNVDSLVVRSNLFTDNNGPAVYMGAGPISNWLITDNKIDGITGASTSGLFLVGPGSMTITSNWIGNTAYAGMVLHGLTDATVSANTVFNVPRQGIQLAGAAGNVTISDNTITDANTGSFADRGGIRLYGADFAGTVTVSGNAITSSFNGLAIKNGQDITGKDIHVTNNDLAGNANAGVYHGGTGVLDASGNWYGSADPAAVAAENTGDVDYTPWLAAGTDTSGDPGFQGDFSALHVDDDSPQVGAQDRISEAIDLVSGSTVIVAAGTYNTRLTITKSVDLLGAQAGIDPTPFGVRTTPAAESVITEAGLSTPNPDVLIEIPSGITNVLIDGFTLEGDPTTAVADTSTVRCWDDNLTIQNNIIDGKVGVLYKGGDSLTVSQNRMTVNKNGVVALPSASTNLVVSGNRFTPGSSLMSDPSAIQMTAVTGGVFSGNTASGFTGGRGLGGSNLHNLDISGNSFTNSKDSISIFGGSTFIDITGNVLSGNTRHGVNIKGQDIAISTNRIMGNADSGISIDRHVIDTERVSVNFNAITGNSIFGVKVNTGTVFEVIDAENNFWGDTSGPEDLLGSDEADNPPCFDPATMKNADGAGNAVTDLGVDYCPWLLGEGSMTLEVPPGCQSDTQISVELWMRDLAKNASGFQAFLTYDDSVLSYNGAASSYTSDPFSLHIQSILTAEVSPGQLNLDGSDSFGGDGTDVDSLLATLVFDVDVECGPTSVAFDTGGAFQSELSFDGTALPTNLVDTPAMTLDSTNPVITCPGPVTVECDEVVGPSTPFGATGATTGGISVYYNTTGPADLSNAAYIRTHVSITNSNGAEYFFDTTPLTGVPGVSWESIFSGIAPLTQFGLDMIRPLPTDDGSVVIPTLTGVDNTDGTPGGATPAGTVSWALNDYKPNAPNGPTNPTNAPTNSIIRGPVGGDPTIDIEIIELQLVGTTLTFSGKLDSDDIIHWFTPATPDSPVINFGLNGDFYISGTLSLAASASGVDHYQGTMTVVANAPTATGVATATDNCTLFPAITVSDDTSGLTLCNGTGDIIRTWTATDDCGLSVSCDQTVTVDDTTAPVIDPAASDSTVECDGAGNVSEFAAWLASHGGAAATDNCGGVTWSNNSTGLSDDCAETGSETVMFTATDDCGNFSTTTATFTIEDTVAPTIGTSPASFDVNADAGGCTAEVTYTAPGATDDCDAAPVVTCLPASGTIFAEGTTLVTCTAVDDCGNSDAGSVWSFEVTVNSVNDVDIDIQLVGVNIASTRCIHFTTKEFGGACGATDDVELPFDGTGSFSGIVELSCGTWTELCVKDEQHTLYDTTLLTDAVTIYTADTLVSLIGGDTDNDSDVDINDVTLFLAQFGDLASDGGCPWDGARDADFSDNGAVGSEDYTFLTTNWLTSSVCECTIGLNGPDDSGSDLLPSISVTKLPADLARRADLNGDGQIDYKDVREFERRNGLPNDLSTVMEASDKDKH